MRLQLHLPPQSGVRVANRGAEPGLPHENGWLIGVLVSSCDFVWQT